MRRSTFEAPELGRDERGVSEVLGQILIFGILSVALVGALIGFNVAKDNATERVVELRADAAAQIIELRIREALDLVILHQESGDGEFNYTFVVDLDDSMEGHGYRIDLDPNQVGISVSALPYDATATIHERASTLYEICDGPDMSGGPATIRALRVDTDPTTGNLAQIPAYCPSPTDGEYLIFLEEGP